MTLFLKLLKVKKTINAVKNDFKEPDSIIDMMLLMLYLEGKLSKCEIEVIEMNLLYRIGISQIIKLPRIKLMKELKKLQSINRKKFEEKRIMENGN